MKRLLFSLGTIAFCGVLAVPVQAQPARSGATPTGKAVAPLKKTTRKSRGRVYLGVYTVPIEDLSTRAKKRLNLTEEEGVIVLEVMPDSPAEEAGLKHGDVITHVNGKAIEDEDELRVDLKKVGAGHDVKLSICREGKKKEMTAKLQAPPEEEMNSNVFAPLDRQEDLTDPFSANSGLAERVWRLERKIAQLEKRLNGRDKTRSTSHEE